eukprot:scaffold7086_cov120-Isochrysis_galbana.AAC.6
MTAEAEASSASYIPRQPSVLAHAPPGPLPTHESLTSAPVGTSHPTNIWPPTPLCWGPIWAPPTTPGGRFLPEPAGP